MGVESVIGAATKAHREHALSAEQEIERAISSGGGGRVFLSEAVLSTDKDGGEVHFRWHVGWVPEGSPEPDLSAYPRWSVFHVPRRVSE